MNGEIVFIRLIEIGRFIDLKRVTAVFPGKLDEFSFESRDTPVIYLPKPLALELPVMNCELKCPIHSISTKLRLYEDGVVSIIARFTFQNASLDQLREVRKLSFKTPEGEMGIEQWVMTQFGKWYPTIRPYVDEDYYLFDPLEMESYTAICIKDDLGMPPEEFVKKNAPSIAALLMGIEGPDVNLHPSQLEATLEHPFSFLQGDLTIFDFDRCIIFDAHQQHGYEDTLFIAELANYQMLNLRCLDRILDERLDVAEDDIRKTFLQSRNPFRKLTKKLGEWLRLRYDMLFILENLENVSKIIGNFYLGNQYKHLCNLFELKDWSTSIRHRLETLGDIYSMARSDVNERILLYVEIILAVIFILEFIAFIIGIGR